MYIKIQLFIFSDQNIKSGFLAIGLILYNPQYVLLLLIVIKTPSLLGILNGVILL